MLFARSASFWLFDGVASGARVGFVLHQAILCAAAGRYIFT